MIVTEELAECVTAVRLWRQAVRDLNGRYSPERSRHERECMVYMNSFHPLVIAEAEQCLRGEM